MDRFNPPSVDLPIHYRPVPKEVRVTNPPKPEFGRDFFGMVRRQYEGLRADLKENELLVMLYHSPAGEQMYVENVFLPKGTDTLIFQGQDEAGNICQVITQAQSVQLMMKVLTRPEPQPDRKPIGFSVVGVQDQTVGGDPAEDTQ